MGVVLRQRTVAVVERDLAHTRRGVLLNRHRTCDERAEMIEERAYHWIFCADRRGQLVGLEQDAAHHRQPLRFIGVEEGRTRFAIHHHRELPGQVDHVLDARVHALGTGGRVDVGGVASQQ